MLRELEVYNLAVVEEAYLSLSPGLNILTGETGAGKSILIDAIGLVLGARASTDYIRTGAEQARVTALFQLPNLPGLKENLLGMGIEVGEGGELLLSRELSLSGKNTCRINGRLTTVSMLRSLGEILVDIHGQHEHQSLLRRESHIDFLDNYGGQEILALRQRVESKYRSYRSLQEELVQLEEKAREQAQKLDLYSFQVAEIAAAGLVPGEEEELLTQRKILQHTEKLLQLSCAVYQLLYEGEEGRTAVVDQLGQAVGWLQEAASLDPQLQVLAENLESLCYQVEELAREVRAYRDKLDLSPGQLEEVEDRLYAIGQLKRKYGNSIEEILAYKAWVEAEIDRLRNAASFRVELLDKLAQLEEELSEDARTLSEKRQALAEELAKRVRAELAQLGMEKTVFAVSITQRNDEKGLSLGERRLAIGRNGFDQVEFLLAPNPGEALKPLARIISGGELSRVMLALKSILAAVDPVPILIFDEIDSGIGGRAAQAVAERLANLARKRQVLCVTHLPQIAAMADAHWKIVKDVVKGHTYTRLVPLDPQDRVAELARMLGGAKVTETTRKHAQEMLELAQKYKNQLQGSLK